jgi:hypothetical protein
LCPERQTFLRRAPSAARAARCIARCRSICKKCWAHLGHKPAISSPPQKSAFSLSCLLAFPVFLHMK